MGPRNVEGTRGVPINNPREGKIRICAIADGRSPIARNWISHLGTEGYEVHLISTFPCDGDELGLASLHVVPVAFSRFAGRGSGAVTRRGLARRALARIVPVLFPYVFGWLGPLDVRRYVVRVRELIREIDPALVHAMRIPYEGILAAEALRGMPYPLLVSIWGNDLELWAARFPGIGRLTRRALRRASALHPDCQRDLRLATHWGWDSTKPAAVLPTNGGVRTELFHASHPDPAAVDRYGLTPGMPIVLNARGFRSYVRNDTFFRAIPLVLAERPDTIFAGVGMQAEPRALRWVRDLGISASVRLLPLVSPGEMASLFRSATVAVSPSEFDGTPNTLLEAMACGAFPVAGDIASVREWIEHGVNGLLCDPANPRSLADAVLRALDDDALRQAAARRNQATIRERADFARVMTRAETLYADAIRAGGAELSGPGAAPVPLRAPAPAGDS